MELTTERLTLREFRDTDWPDILAYQRDPRYLRYYEWTERTPKAVQEFLQVFLNHQRDEPRTKFQLAIVLTATTQLIGGCAIRKRSVDAHEADIGYELSPEHWGQGYATEAAAAIVAFGFTQLRLHRISAWCVADNAGSVGVLTKLGMQLEGRLRDKEYFKGRWWDTLMFAILEDEWRSRQSPVL